MWRQLLEYTDSTGKAMLGCAAAALGIAVISFVVGVTMAVSGNAARTLPFWLATMGCAVIAGVLVYLASRRGDFKRR